MDSRGGRRVAVVGLLLVAVAVGVWTLTDRDEAVLPPAQGPPAREPVDESEREIAVEAPRLEGQPGVTTTSKEATTPDEAPTPTPLVAPRYATFRGTVVSAETGSPIPVVRFTLWLASDDANHDDRVSHDVLADRDGQFEVQAVATQKLILLYAQFVRNDLLPHGWTQDGTALTEGPRAGPGETVRFELPAAETISLQGVVLDQSGRPLEGVKFAYTQPSGGGPVWGGFVGTSRDTGRFSVERVLANPEAVIKSAASKRVGLVHFAKNGYASRRLSVYEVPEADRRDWRVVLTRGRRLSGRLVDPSGRGLPGVEIEAAYEDPAWRRTARTDSKGGFLLETLADGSVTLGALVLDRELEARREIPIGSDLDGVVLVASPVDLSHPLHPIYVMGLRLVGATDELRKSYRLPAHVNVMILDPGPNHERLQIGTLRAGYGIWKIGNEKVASVADLIDRILAQHAEPPWNTSRTQVTRIVYTINVDGQGWTSTQHLALTEQDLDSLRRARNGLR